MSHRFLQCLAVSLPALLSMGCGSGQVVNELRGQVNLDGQPAQKLVLLFWHVNHLHEPFGGGVTELDGTYTIETKKHEAATKWLTGDYVVQVDDPPQLHPYRTKEQPPLSSIYRRPASSPLRVSILEGDNSLPTLELESEKSPVIGSPGPVDRDDFGR